MPIYDGVPNSRELGVPGGRSRCSGHDPPPTALLAMSDEIALGAMRRSRATRAWTCPAVLSVVGFDDAPAAAPRAS